MTRNTAHIYEYNNIYDDHNNLIEVEMSDCEGVLQYIEYYTYDDRGNVLTKKNCFADGSVNYEISAQYDENGNEIVETKIINESAELTWNIPQLEKEAAYTYVFTYRAFQYAAE